jgi:hypothetical protein
MKNVLKPAEFMGNILKKLNNNNDENNLISSAATTKDKIEALKELESLLCDIDNARDFHTIGGWPILLSLLSTEQPIEIKTLVAWCIGSAIKNRFCIYILYILFIIIFNLHSYSLLIFIKIVMIINYGF